MSLLTISMLFVSGVLTGMINAVAGGGTFLSFGTLTFAGIPPVVANATSSITQFPGYVTSTLAYWDNFKAIWREALALAIASVLGALAGSWILLQLDNPSFRALVPWLLIAATALFAAGPWLKPKPKPGRDAAVGGLFGWLLQLATSIYGGFFGAGMGVMMLGGAPPIRLFGGLACAGMLMSAAFTFLLVPALLRLPAHLQEQHKEPS